MYEITLEDARRHRPDDVCQDHWQESFFLGWYDSATRSGGHHHVSLMPNKKSAHVWSWLIVDGAIAGRQQQHVLPLPEGDFDDLDVGSLRLTQGDNLRRLRLRADFQEASLDLDYEALCHPLEVGLNPGGLVLGKRHYESMGAVSGVARVGARQVSLSGGAWQDHSWGVRQFYAHRAGRWLFAVFGRELAISAFTYMTPDGRRDFGWVFDKGTIRKVSRAVFRACVDDDGITPLGCDATIYTDDSEELQVRGHVDASAITGDSAWYSKDGLARFECRGLSGDGILEVNELKSLPPDLREELEI
jgi:hypothetical protein